MVEAVMFLKDLGHFIKTSQVCRLPNFAFSVTIQRLIAKAVLSCSGV